MTISEDQLRTWTNAPASTKSSYTYGEVKKALEKSTKLKGLSYEVYLQGSYANSTNIKLDSDVDIAVQLNSTFSPDISAIPFEQQVSFYQTVPQADYNWSNFCQDVIDALTAHFGTSVVKPDKKCIKLIGDNNRVNADIVPCVQHRQFNSFAPLNQTDFIEGMKFWTDSGKEVTNYPKLHLKNGENKNAAHRTDEKYKHLTRILKNIRRRLIEDHAFNPDTARSYFIECAVYNVPDIHFGPDYKSSLEGVIDYILHKCNPDAMLTVSHQHILFGLEPWQWNANDAGVFFQLAHQYYQSN